MTTIELDRVREIKYPLKSIRRGREEFKVGIVSLMDGCTDTLVDILWIGLITDDPTLSRNKLDILIEEWIKTGHNYREIDQLVAAALKEYKIINIAEDDIKN